MCHHQKMKLTEHLFHATSFDVHNYCLLSTRSSVMSLYATYLAWSIVSKNPDHTCNPALGHNDTWGIAVGLLLTTISLAWTGWSWSAEERLNVDSVQSAKAVTPKVESSGGDHLNLDVPFLDADEQPTSGLVTEQTPADTMSSGVGSHVWKLNVVMTLISCYVAMLLTGFGTLNGLDDNMNAANPTVGRVNMAILGVSQWLAIGLYIWTLVAPVLFPDRDFS
jgi:serine incorporator 1/3